MFLVGANVCLERGKHFYIYRMKSSIKFHVTAWRILLICTTLGIIPLEVLSKPLLLSAHESGTSVAVLLEQKQDKPSKQTRPTKKQVRPTKTVIKMVPKSRRQVKPTVIKPKVKVKPIKIIRPKISL